MAYNKFSVDIGRVYEDGKHVTKDYHHVHRSDFLWKEKTSIVQPVFSCEAFDGWVECNYVKITGLNRNYYITNMEMDSYGILWVTCNADDLANWWSYISQINTLIMRQENVWSPYIQDNLLPVRTERIIEYQKIGNIGNPHGQNIVLTVSGGYEEIVPSGKAEK